MKHMSQFVTTTFMVLVSCQQVFGQWQDWTDAKETHRWKDPGNWTTDLVPTVETEGVVLKSLPGPTITGTAAVKSFVRIGADKDSRLTISKGGSLTVKTAVALGCTDKVTGTLVMSKGSSLNVHQFYLGTGGRTASDKALSGKGQLLMGGGTIECTYFIVARIGNLGAEGSALLKAGTVKCWDFNMSRDCIIPPRVDIWDAMIVQSRNDVKRVKDWVHSGWIVGFGGKGEVVVDFDTADHPNCTVITAKRTSLE